MTADRLRAAADRLDETETTFVMVDFNDCGDAIGEVEVPIGPALAAWLRAEARAHDLAPGFGGPEQDILAIVDLILGGSDA